MKAYLLAIVFGIVLISGCLQGQCPDDNKPVCGSNGVTYKNACFARQANITKFNEGACSAACSDSDGGKDIFTFGTVNEGGSESRDSCPSPGSVLERFCQGGSALSENLPCPAGYACDGGACVSVPCSDSDGGLNENVKGSVTSAGKDNPDDCVGPTIVREYYCEAGKTAFKDISCGAGMACASGACAKVLCSDTDGGKDAAVKGTAKVGSQSNTDNCADASSVNEYFCDGDLLKLEKISCGAGSSCMDGKCAKNVCTDSDGGKNIQVKGQTSLGAVTYNDTCYSDTSVLEYFCATDASVGNDPTNCGTNNECFDGRCRPIQCVVNQTDIDDVDKRRQIQSFDDSDELTLFAGNTVEINDGMYLRLQSVGVNSSSFRLYLTLNDMLDDDEECSETINEGDVESDLCGENTGDVEVITQDDSSDTAEIRLEEYYAVQIYTQDGVVRDWTDKPTCHDDEVIFNKYEADFYPYLDTDTGGLNLDGRDIEFMGTLSELREVTADTVTLRVNDETLDLQDGDTFEYLDNDYDVELVFNDGGLERMVIRPS